MQTERICSKTIIWKAPRAGATKHGEAAQNSSLNCKFGTNEPVPVGNGVWSVTYNGITSPYEWR